MEQASACLGGCRILLVEDNEINLQVARELLEQVGARVSVAGNGQIAVDMAAQQRFDCILMDLQMPVMDGYAAARAIRSDPERKNLPILAMTANVMAEAVEQCTAAGMDGHIRKPIHPPTLYETLCRHIPPMNRPLEPRAEAVSMERSPRRPPNRQTPVPLPESLPGVDMEAGLRRVNGNRELYRDVLRKVYRRFGDIVERIQAEIDRGALDEARRLAHTFIPNRRQFDRSLASEWERSLRHGHALSLLLVDIDFFKPYNDHYGHTEGDECLKRVARAIREDMIRAEDLAARYGGEEFACILPQTDNGGAIQVARRILHSVRALGIPHAKSAAEQVTVSIGVATAAPAAADTAYDLIETADRALYRAKQRGRDRIDNAGVT